MQARAYGLVKPKWNEAESLEKARGRTTPIR